MIPSSRLMPRSLLSTRWEREEVYLGQIPLLLVVFEVLSIVGTNNLIGPGTYFQRGGKSHSTSSLSRVPYDSKIKNAPVVSFAKGPKSLTAFKSSVDETYDIKT